MIYDETSKNPPHLESRLVLTLEHLNGPHRLRALKETRQKYNDQSFRECYRRSLSPFTMRHYPVQSNQCKYNPLRYLDNPRGRHGPFRFYGYADTIITLHHTGWYCDFYHDETYRGIVYRLTGRKGAERFIAGYVESFNDSIVVDLSHFWDDEIGAAREADRLAEYHAEESRVFYAKDAAQNRITDIDDELITIRTTILDLCRAMRASCPMIEEHPPIITALRSKISQYLAERTNLVRERTQLEADGELWPNG